MRIFFRLDLEDLSPQNNYVVFGKSLYKIIIICDDLRKKTVSVTQICKYLQGCKKTKQKMHFCWVQISDSRPKYILLHLMEQVLIIIKHHRTKKTNFNSKMSFSINSGLYLQCSAQSTTGWSHSFLPHTTTESSQSGSSLPEQHVAQNSLTVTVHSPLIQVPSIGTSGSRVVTP